MSRLTQQQRLALAALADGGEHTPSRLANALATSKEGAATTASSLVRRGHVARLKDRGLVFYRITAQGLEQVRHDQTAFT